MRILIAGVGNVFQRDDAFGTEVIRRLPAAGLPGGVSAVDYGIRGMHLAYDLLDGWDTLILVDAIPDRGQPGTLHVLEVGEADLGSGEIDAHGMAPAQVLAGLERLGGTLPCTLLVGCEVHDTDEGMGLSVPVSAAADRAVRLVQSLVERLVPVLERRVG
jgi:hydrogenase maturation protease